MPTWFLFLSEDFATTTVDTPIYLDTAVIPIFGGHGGSESNFFGMGSVLLTHSAPPASADVWLYLSDTAASDGPGLYFYRAYSVYIPSATLPVSVPIATALDLNGSEFTPGKHSVGFGITNNTTGTLTAIAEGGWGTSCNLWEVGSATRT